MARFYAEIVGQAKTSATRTGSTSSGIRGHIRGWDVGVSVEGFNLENGEDIFAVTLTSGSNGRYGRQTIGHVTLNADGRPVFTPSTALLGKDEVTL